VCSSDLSTLQESESHLTFKVQALMTSYGFEIDEGDKIESIMTILESLFGAPESRIPDALADDEEEIMSD
jgi:hypothetical protein